MKVLTFGTFDIVHPGHIFYLEYAKSQGSLLYTVIASDYISENLKQRKNIYNQKDRMQHIEKLNIADVIIAGSNTNPLAILNKIQADIIVLGHDQKAPIEAIQKALPLTKILRAPKFKDHIFKSSLIKKNAFIS